MSYGKIIYFNFFLKIRPLILEQDHHDHNAPNANSTTPKPRISDNELMKLVDEILKDEDKNLDGYITYQEFLVAIKG